MADQRVGDRPEIGRAWRGELALEHGPNALRLRRRRDAEYTGEEIGMLGDAGGRIGEHALQEFARVRATVEGGLFLELDARCERRGGLALAQQARVRGLV